MRARWWVLGGAVVLLALTVVVIGMPASRDQSRYRDGHAAYLRGDCAEAVRTFDSLIGAWRLFESGDSVSKAKTERTECQALLAIDGTAATDPAGALAAYLDFQSAHATSPLAAAVPARATKLVTATAPERLADPATCTALPTLMSSGWLDDAAVPEMRAACLTAFDNAGRTSDAQGLAFEILADADAPGADAAAEFVAVHAPCTDVMDVIALDGLATRLDRAGDLLARCIGERSGADATELQLEFAIRFPGDAATDGYLSAVLAAADSCAYADRVQAAPSLRTHPAFLADFYFRCANLAESTGSYDDAVTFYQAFLDLAPDDARAGDARDGLARSLVAQAKAQGAGTLPAPTPTGGSGSARAEVVVFNQSPHELRVVVSGPDSEIETIPACGDCIEYSLIGPPTCRTDVPSITLDLPAGTFDVLAETTDGSVKPFVGSWALDAGEQYQSCFFIVATLGG